MKTLFTVNAGEFLVGSKIEAEMPWARVWVPSKDTGIDLLVTDAGHTRSVALQVKFSRDFLVTHMDSMFQQDMLACGWWTLTDPKKIRASKADLWILVLQAFDPKRTQYVLIPPAELAGRLSRIHGETERIHSYLWVTKKGKCWEARGITSVERDRIIGHTYANDERDFGRYLNAWDALERTLRGDDPRAATGG